MGKKNITYTKGSAISISHSIWNFSTQGGISIDTNGNVAIQATYSTTVTVSSGSAIAVYDTITNAQDTTNLEGIGYQVGGSVGIPVPAPISVVAGADFNIIPSSEKNNNYYGVTIFTGISPPNATSDFHVGAGETVTVCKFNVFDVMRNVYIRIMEE